MLDLVTCVFWYPAQAMAEAYQAHDAWSRSTEYVQLTTMLINLMCDEQNCQDDSTAGPQET